MNLTSMKEGWGGGEVFSLALEAVLVRPLTSALLCLALALLHLSTWRPPNFPPGLARLPVVGMVFRGLAPRKEFWHYRVLGHFVGNWPTVTIQDFALARELFAREEWCGRLNTLVCRYLRSDKGKNRGIAFAEGKEWADTRRIFLKHLKDFWFGSARLEGVIQGEVEELVTLLATTKGKDFKMETVFSIPVINILWTIVAGTRFQLGDPEAEQMLGLINRILSGPIVLEYFLPWWGLVCSLVPGLNTRITTVRKLRAMFRKSIKEHKETRDPHQPRDFIDEYLSEMERGVNPNFDQEGLELTCLDLFKAGGEATSTTLLWCVLYLTCHPEVQARAREEVERVTGEERPGLHHSLPYCQATIQEVQRLVCVAPTSLPHRVTKPVTVEGLSVPANSLALYNLMGFMQDPDHWDQPLAFLPERFLERSGDSWRLLKKERFVPYGFGRRVCLGEAMARDTLIIFFSTLVKHLRFDQPSDHPKPNPANYTQGLGVMPRPFHVTIRPIAGL